MGIILGGIKGDATRDGGFGGGYRYPAMVMGVLLCCCWRGCVLRCVMKSPMAAYVCHGTICVRVISGLRRWRTGRGRAGWGMARSWR